MINLFTKNGFTVLPTDMAVPIMVATNDNLGASIENFFLDKNINIEGGSAYKYIDSNTESFIRIRVVPDNILSQLQKRL